MNKNKLVLIVILLLNISVAQAHSPSSHAKVFFVDIVDGAEVSSPFKVKFGIMGYGITPAGTTGKIRHTAGHHHLLIDVKESIDMDETIPDDMNYRHFNKGEAEVVLNLKHGKHTLQLVLGDEEHEPLSRSLVSSKITINVR